MDKHESQTVSPNPTSRFLACGLAIAAGLLRLVPHPFNFAPVGALGLFGGARLGLGLALVLPVAVMAGSDLLLWKISGFSPFNPYVYASFLLNVVLGRLFLRSGSAWRIGAVSLLTSLQFFLITNFGVWLASSAEAYPMPDGKALVIETKPGEPFQTFHFARTLPGLLACYGVALPFFGTDAPPLGFLGNQVVGDLFFCGLLFGLQAALQASVFARRRTQPAILVR
jgi:hypothetical protein